MAKPKFQLPAAEDDLWNQVVVRLLSQRDADEQQARDHLRLLEELAFHYRFCERPLTRTFVEDTTTWLAEERKFGSPRDKAHEWLADLERWELLVRRGGGPDITYEFAIPTLDEYFAARHLSARWADGDKRYRAWLPCRWGWWWRGGRLLCPNPNCHISVPSFRKLLRSAEHEESILLLVGLLKESEQEKTFLRGFSNKFNIFLLINPFVFEFIAVWPLILFFILGILSIIPLVVLDRIGILDNPPLVLKIFLLFFGFLMLFSPVMFFVFIAYEEFRKKGFSIYNDLNFALKALSRCHHGHYRIIQSLCNKKVLGAAGGSGWERFSHIREGLTALGKGRIRDNVDPLFSYCKVVALRKRGRFLGSTFQAAVDTIGQIGDIRSIEMLTMLVRDEDAGVREIAARALEYKADEMVVEPLVKTLKDANEKVRAVTAYVLGQTGDVRTVEPLIVAIQDEYTEVREAAAGALGTMVDERVVEPLITALKDEYADVREAAAESLGRILDERAVEPLIIALKDKADLKTRNAAKSSTSVRKAVARSLGKIGNSRAVELLLATLSDEDSELRKAAANALGQKYTGRLQTLLDDLARLVRRPVQEED